MKEAVAHTSRPRTWSREQLVQILSAVSDAVTVQDSNGSIVFANAEARRLLGIEEPSLVATTGDSVLARFEVLDESGERFNLDELPGRRVMRGEPSLEVVVCFRSEESGKERWARVSSRPVAGPDGTIEFAVNTFRDITDSRGAENRVRFQAELLNQVEAAVIATDEAGSISYWNKTADHMFGWTTPPAGLQLAAILLPAAEDDDTVVSEPPIESVLLGRRWEGEASVATPTGERVPVYVALSPVEDGRSRVIGLAAAMFDLSERRRAESQLRMSEARYRTLADSLPHLVWTARPDGSIDQYNARYIEYTGVSAAQSAGWGWTDLVHPEDLPGLVQLWTASLGSGKDLETEFRLRRFDGAYRWFVARSMPLHNETGEIVSWIGTATDIDDRKRAERGLAFLAEASRVLNEDLDYESTLASVARLAVPHVADWCRVDLVNAAGDLETVAIAHVDEAKVELAREVQRRWPARLDSPRGIAQAIRTGQSELIEEIPDELLDSLVADPELREILRRLGLSSSMVVPLLGDSGPIGAISFVAAESGRHFGRADLALAEDLARRAASSIDNALLYRRVNQFKGALDNSTDCVFMFDPTTLRFTYVNRGAVAQVGYTASELLRMTPLDLKPEFDERSYRALIEPVVSGELSSRTFETVQRRKDGVLIPVDVVLQRIPISPDGLHVIAFVRDVSDRVETQARLRRLAQAERTRAAELDAVIRAMGEAVMVFDADGLITLSNPAADALFSDVAVTRWTDVVGLFETDDVRLQLAADQPQGPIELRLKGSRRWVEATSYPVLVEPDVAQQRLPGVTVGVMILVMRDVSPQREAASMREAFVGVLSHELRTPVTTIFGSAKVLERAEGRLPDDARRGIYADIAAESERLYRLVEDLLVLARFGDVPLTLGDEPVLLQRVLPTAVTAEQSRWPATQFKVEVEPGLPTVRADPTYVEQVARNLLSNAAKYASSGGVVTLSIHVEDGEVAVAVRDNGPGFPADEGDKLFDLFYRSPQTATQATGAGIGLFVCRRLIEAMGGRIWARNLESGGAEFGFVLQRFIEDE